MHIIKKVRLVKKVFNNLDNEINSFQKQTGLKCIENCSLCCTKKNIEANILEFLPLAFHLYETNKAYEYLEKIELNESGICYFLNPFNSEGGCTFYKYRGLICRLFGYAANEWKDNKKMLITCKLIKSDNHAYLNAQNLINRGLPIPIISNYYMKLYAIDFKLASEYYSINNAIQKAIELILFHYNYRNKKAS